MLTAMFASPAKAQFNLVGYATQSGTGCVRLTGAQTFQTGAMWFTKQVDLRQDMDIRARVYLGSNRGNGADGMAFVLQRQSINAGSSAEGLGYGGITPSLVVEMDTYRNSNRSDPDNRHMALMANGNPNHAGNLTVPVSIMPDGSVADNGEYLNFRFEYTAATKRIRVFINCVLRIDYTGDVLTNQFAGQPMVYWGFTAATGGSVNEHSVCDIYNNQQYIGRRTDTICYGDSAQFKAAPIPNSRYSWSPATELSDPNVADPWCKATQSRQYICTVTDTCYNLIFKDTVNILVPQPVFHNSSTNSPLCGNSPLVLQISPQRPDCSYGWKLPDGSINASASPVITSPESGNYIAFARQGACEVYRQAHTVLVKPAPAAEIDGRLGYCAGDTLKLTGPATAGSWQWTGPGGTVVSTTSGLTIQNVPVAASGRYILTTGHALNDCVGRDTVFVTVSPKAVAVIDLEKAVICEGHSVILKVDAVSPFIWNHPDWLLSPAATGNVFAKPRSNGWLVLNSSTGSGCSAGDSVYFRWLRLPRVEAGPDRTIFAGDATLLNAQVSGDSLRYQWSLPGGIFVSDRASVSVLPVVTTTYRFTAESLAGCGIAADTVHIKVLPKLIVPNAFSPNGDGINDRWLIAGIEQYRQVELGIFNRYGQPVYNGRPPARGWDGTIGGRPLPMGTYYYVLRAPELETALSGWVIIVL